ncbi:MAG: hypothetical protein V1784_04905, partial [bacterium]
GTGGYPAQLVLQDALTLHGSQFRDAALIVASPPCQEFSYMAMPWSKAKAKERDLLEGRDDPKRLTALFDACFRIQREAIEAAGHFIPLVVENVRGAQKWVGRSRANYGSFHLWGDVPALMPMTKVIAKAPGHSMNQGAAAWRPANALGFERPEPNLRDDCKVPGFRFDGSGKLFQTASVEGVKVASEEGRRTDIGKGARFTTRDCGDEGIKQHGSGRAWFADEGKISRETSSKSPARKAASAAIAKIPMPLARHIARYWNPHPNARAA